MKYLIILTSILFCMGCNEKNNKPQKTLNDSQNPSEKTLDTKTKNSVYEKQIISGERLGNLILNENSQATLDSLGKPDSSDAAMGKAVMSWKKGENNLLILYTTTQMGVENFSRIKAIRSLSNNFKTVDNLGVSSSIEELKRYYRLDPTGKFTFNGKHYFLYTTNKGIAFEIGMDQKCNGILLYPKDVDPESLYIPIYSNFKKL